MNYWSQFARSGSPNGEMTENLPFWKKWPVGGKNQDRIMILDSIERVENSEEMPEMYTDTSGDNSSSEKSFGFNRKPSKKFNLMYHTKNFKFKPEDNE